MEFRAPNVAAEQNAKALQYLTRNLEDPELGRREFEKILVCLGNAVGGYPDWHPILTAPSENSSEHVYSLRDVSAYRGIDHTVAFVKGFVSCPYSEEVSDRIVKTVNKISGLSAYRSKAPLYDDTAHPVVVVADEIELEADGTIRSRDALIFFAEQAVKEVRTAQVAETWWNIRPLILGQPHGSRSSLFVNQHAAAHMRKILEALNASGIYGPIKEVSLEMLSQKKRDAISETLLQAAKNAWNRCNEEFEFEMRGETCRASVRDTWDDGEELSIRVVIGELDLRVAGYFYQREKKFTFHEPIGKRVLAEKFL